MSTLFINGKFAAQPMTGVQRFATELLAAADRIREEQADPPRWVLLHPAGAVVPALRTVQCRALGPARLPLHLWEQLLLPMAARGPLLNLTGSAPLWRRRQICTFHDAAVFDWPQAYTGAFVRWYRLLFRTQARRARLLVTVSEFGRARLAHHLKLAPERLALVPEGAEHLGAVEADDAVLDRLDLRGRRYVLSVASASPAKNLERLVSAAERLPPAVDGSLVMVGRSNPGVFAATACAARSRVRMAGPVDDPALAALYRHARGLAFPSLYEGFGLPALEAMSLGCPVVAARAAALPEVCGAAVRYVDPESIEDIAAALCELLTDDRLCSELADRGRARAAAFTWRASAQALMAHLQGLEAAA